VVIQDAPSLSLELDSRPECVALVRAMLGGIAEPLGLDGEAVNDLKTAVSEACNNVVVHAYEGGAGPMTVEVAVEEGAISVTVRDWGRGLSIPAPSEDRLGVGMAVISSLADRVEFVGKAGGGTAVHMTFPARVETTARCETTDGRHGGEDLEPLLGGDVRVTLRPVSLLPTVLGRLARSLAASARFSVDRLSDLSLVTDTLAAHAQEAANRERISFAITAENRSVEISIGPFRAGAGVALSGEARSERWPVAALANELRVESVDRSELVRLILRDDRAGR
jgi:serine/threonine-protein kinase RsbW